MNTPVEDYLKTIIKDPSLRDMISQHFFRNTPAFFALSYFSLYLDYFYPRGGTGRLAEAQEKKLVELGGEIRTETKITGVFPAEHLVSDDKDIRYHYKNLIWAADLKTLYKITGLNTYEISIPGLKDAGMAPAGKTGVIISLLAEYDLFRQVEKAGWLDEFVRELEDRIIRVISGSVYPVLKDKVIGRFSFTPLSIENRIGSSEGGITGWAFQASMPVINKIQIADRSVLTPIPSVYQVGQWVYSPGGVPMSILTGMLAADR